MRRRCRVWGLAVLAVAAVGPSCTASQDIAEQRFEPRVAGTLTVATSLPAPGFWDGNSVEQLTGGFEWGIAAALADRFDLTLAVIDVPFEQLIAGDLGGADMALAQITITPERRDHVAFSTPYYIDDAGAVLLAGEELTDLKTAKEQRWAVERGTVEQGLLADDVRPDHDPVLVDDPVAAVDAVAGGRVDAALVDLSTALVLTKGRTDVTTGGRFTTNGEMAIALPKDSDNVEAVDAALRAFESDRTLSDLRARYLDPAFEKDPDAVPVVRTPDG
jgi:polar amino acid transport system substrate-binding protein